MFYSLKERFETMGPEQLGQWAFTIFDVELCEARVKARRDGLIQLEEDTWRRINAIDERFSYADLQDPEWAGPLASFLLLLTALRDLGYSRWVWEDCYFVERRGRNSQGWCLDLSHNHGRFFRFTDADGWDIWQGSP